jgi:hypothetical protein
MPDYPAPTLGGIRLILENFSKEYPDAPRRDPKEFVDSSSIERPKGEHFAEVLQQPADLNYFETSPFDSCFHRVII